MSDDSLEIPTDTGRSTPEPTSMGEGLPLYVVAPRSGRLFSRLLPAFLVVVIAGAVLAYRLVTPDWRGLSAWSWPRRARPSPSAALQPPLALAGSPKRQKVQAGPTESQPTPAEAEKSKSVAGAEAKEAEGEAVAKAPETGKDAQQDPKDKDKDEDAWDEIRREAERKKAELAAIESMKQKAEEKAEQAPTPRWGRRWDFHAFPPPPMERMWREQMERHQQQVARLLEAHRRQFEAFARRQRPPIGPFAGMERPPVEQLDRMLREFERLQREQLDRLEREFRGRPPGAFAPDRRANRPAPPNGLRSHWRITIVDPAHPHGLVLEGRSDGEAEN